MPEASEFRLHQWVRVRESSGLQNYRGRMGQIVAIGDSQWCSVQFSLNDILSFSIQELESQEPAVATRTSFITSSDIEALLDVAPVCSQCGGAGRYDRITDNFDLETVRCGCRPEPESPPSCPECQGQRPLSCNTCGVARQVLMVGFDPAADPDDRSGETPWHEAAIVRGVEPGQSHCPACDGTGDDPSMERSCTVCRGSGLAPRMTAWQRIMADHEGVPKESAWKRLMQDDDT